MRYGIREFLIVISVVVSGLATSVVSSAADDPQPASSNTTESATTATDAASAPEQAKAAPKADEPATESPSPETASETTAPQAEESAAAPHPETESAKETSEGTSPAHPEPHGGASDKHPTDGHADAAHPDAGHDGEHHDPYDLTHVNATPAIEDPSEVKSDLAIWTFVVFLLLLALLAKFAWGPILEGLERREASIAAAIEEAEQAAAKGAETLKQYEAKLAAAADETREMLAQARKDAEATGERIVAEAQETAKRERERAIAEISTAKNVALSEITERSVDLAVAMAGRMIQRQLTPDDRATLIREALDQLPNQN